MIENKVLIVTGGLLNAKETSLWSAIGKQTMQFKAARNHWLETKIKVVAAEPLVMSLFKNKTKNDVLKNFFSKSENYTTPELTEVVLADLLTREKMPFDIMTYDTLFSDKKKAALLLKNTNVIFASSTLLHDLSALEPLIKMLKKPHNKIILGGALAGNICKDWEGSKDIDILAIGYGEMLVPAIVKWINSGFCHLEPNVEGRIVNKTHTIFYYSGVPKSLSLDFLPTPDWRVVEKYHGKKYNMINYESMRGCPYRCSFCNYPYLFDDTKFRTKSAEKMADDWEKYQNELGVKYITCLDSLFTMPKKRLVQFCNLLIKRNIKIKWIGYARADDLTDEEILPLMKAAGAQQLQIGIESGNQTLLDNMNKKCSVESNLIALENCRKYGITSLITLIAGFPGETKKTLEDTFQFMKQARPDFYFLATFSIRVNGVPILNEENKARFGLRTVQNGYSFAPYWAHNTMSCREVGNLVRDFNDKIMREKISLDGNVFYSGILNYEVSQKEALLEYQKQLITSNGFVKFIFNRINHWVDKKLNHDFKNYL
jgi:anaerobic magnesium-protoporphyrin IX monomethyl ester cyclase